MFSLIYVALTRTTTRFGTPALAALGLGHRVESWLYTIGVGFGAAAAAIVGQNLGAGKIERAERAGWTTLGFATVPALIAAVAAFMIPDRLAGLFTAEPAVIDVAARYLRIGALADLTVCAEIVLEGALGGAGHTVPPMLTSTSLTLLRIPLAWWAAGRWGVDGIWWTISLTATARGVAMVLLWRAGGWKHKSV
jgi:Na+-driven multidrug efflux pump